MARYPYRIDNNDQISNDLILYLKNINKARLVLINHISPLLTQYFHDYEFYKSLLKNKEIDINYENPMIHSNKEFYTLYMLLIETANQFWLPLFNSTKKKIVVLPRCVSGPEFNLLKIKRTKFGWHQIVGAKNLNDNAWILSQMSQDHNFEVFITMGSRFKEPNFLRVFKNLRKKFGNFGLIAVACIPELALGNTYIMEMGIPSHAVPLFFSGCAKWHGSSATVTKFPLNYILNILKIKK